MSTRFFARVILCVVIIMAATAWVETVPAATLNVGTHDAWFSDPNLSRGYWFQAPTDFRIDGLRVPGHPPTQLFQPQNIQVIRLFGPPPTVDFPVHTTLLYANNFVGDVLPANIHVEAGDFIGILGTRGTTTMYNSYSQFNSMLTSIDGHGVIIRRLSTQQNINTAAAGAVSSSSDPDLPFARVEMFYTAVPEPSAFLLLTASAVSIVCLRSRRSKK